MNRFENRPLYRYAATLAIIFLASALQYLVVFRAKVAVPGLLYPATFLVAAFFGFRPALLAIITAVFISTYTFYEPRFQMKLLHWDDGLRIAIFAVTSLCAAWVVARGRKALRAQARTHAALKGLQVRFERFADASGLGIFYCDLPFSELVWNPQLKEQFWLPADARVTIETFYERIHPDDRDRVHAAIAHSVSDHASYDITYRTVNPRNPQQIKHVRAIGWTDYNQDNEPIRFDGITLDYTSLKKISAERDESIEVLETLNRLGRSLSAQLDLEKLVQEVTDVATQLSRAEFGAFFYNVQKESGEAYMLYTLSGVPREKFSAFPMPRNTAVFAPTFAGQGVVRSDDIRKDPRYGQNAPHYGMPKDHLPVASYLAVPVISRSGEVIGALFFGHSRPGVFTDREERIVTGLASHAAVAVDNARLFEKSQQAVKIRDEFLSISSHELRTPLTPLKMQLQSMARSLEKGPVSHERFGRMLETCDKQVSRLTVLIEDLLDVSRISAGQLSLNFEQLDLAELVRETAERYQLQLQSVGCELRLHLLPTLIAQVDRLRFEQILINLLTNAMKYAAGKPIDLSLGIEEGLILLRVKDQGVGIAIEDQKRVFGRFERAGAGAFGGLGLGLFIVQKIVSGHGGTIAVESELGKGSTFIARLPVRQSAPGEGTRAAGADLT